MLAEYKKAGMKLKGKAVFVYLDITKESNSRVMEFFSLKAEDGTQFRVITMGDEMKKFKGDLAEFTEASFATFVQDVLDGKVAVSFCCYLSVNIEPDELDMFSGIL